MLVGVDDFRSLRGLFTGMILNWSFIPGCFFFYLLDLATFLGVLTTKLAQDEIYKHIDRIDGIPGANVVCRLCGKTFSKKQNCFQHLETVHFPGILTYSCDICGESFAGKNKLYLHRSKYHVKVSR